MILIKNTMILKKQESTSATLTNLLYSTCTILAFLFTHLMSSTMEMLLQTDKLLYLPPPLMHLSKTLIPTQCSQHLALCNGDISRQLQIELKSKSHGSITVLVLTLQPLLTIILVPSLSNSKALNARSLPHLKTSSSINLMTPSKLGVGTETPHLSSLQLQSQPLLFGQPP